MKSQKPNTKLKTHYDHTQKEGKFAVLVDFMLPRK